ncbi:hypothetical protein NL676_011545 [Syzygium grande]|nr:hypothetical protein NL676_011545 [Syzygium grande]
MPLGRSGAVSGIGVSVRRVVSRCLVGTGGEVEGIGCDVAVVPRPSTDADGRSRSPRRSPIVDRIDY